MPAPAIASRATENILLPSDHGVAFATVDMRAGVRGRWQVDVSEEDDRVRAVQRIRGLAWLPDGSLLVASADKVRCFDGRGEFAWQWSPARSFGFTVSCPQGIAVDEGGIVLAVDDGEMVRLSYAGKLIKHRKDDAGPRWMATTNAGLVGTDGYTLTRWDTELLAPDAGARLPEKAMGFGSNGKYVAVRGLRRVVVLDPETLELVADFPSGGGLPVLALHPNRNEIALADVRSVLITDFAGTELGRHPKNGPVTALAYLADALLTSADGF